MAAPCACKRCFGVAHVAFLIAGLGERRPIVFKRFAISTTTLAVGQH